jgi:hypothetical protein
MVFVHFSSIKSSGFTMSVLPLLPFFCALLSRSLGWPAHRSLTFVGCAPQRQCRATRKQLVLTLSS